MKKKVIIFSTAILVVAIALIVVWNKMSDYSGILEANWGFSLPKAARCTEMYEQDSGASFHGDGIRYHVFSYKNEEYIDTMFAWSSIENGTRFYSSYSEAANAWLNEIAVPEEEYPDYDNCVFWYHIKEDNNEIVIFWDAEENKLYILESLM